MLQAVLFDMDGLLIDSEPLWQKAEMHVFSSHGVELSQADCISTMGMRIDDVVRHWFERRPWENASLEQVLHEILAEVIRLIKLEGEKKPGVDSCLELCQAKNLRIGLASASYQEVIEAVLEKLRLWPFFEIVHSAEFEAEGKPAPDVYLTAAKMLDVPASSCLVLEDSLNGVRAAKSAGMTCVAVPDHDAPRDLLEAEADYTLNSLLEVDVELFESVSEALE